MSNRQESDISFAPRRSAPAKQDAVEVSAVIPCLNEAQSLGICIDKALHAFREAGVSGEVVVADNGSTDGSPGIASEHGARVIHVQARGYGNALRAGIVAARGQFIIMGDADDSYDFSEIARFVQKWREGYDIVMGNRFLGEIKSGAMRWHHQYFGNPILSGLLRLFFHSPVHDAHCGMRGFTADVYRRLDLRTTGMEFASEFVIKATRLGAKMTEIPITLWPDKRGRPPHLRSFRDGWRHLRFMLLYAPNWLFLVPGSALSLLGIFLVMWLVSGPRVVNHFIFDVHTMMFGLMFAIVGAQIVSIGTFAKVFSYAERFDHDQRSLENLLRRITFEHGLIVGTVLALAGLCGDIWVIWEWASTGFGPVRQAREVIFWSLPLFLGIQIIFSSFFLSMLGISRGTYIGDYDLKN
jgi:glycosyltransferase involved in cell wall biosynthesis